MSSINDLVKYFCRHTDKECAHNLIKTGDKHVTILPDGLDELPEHLQGCGFITELLEHHILHSCNVIVSSRPHASAYLHSYRSELVGYCLSATTRNYVVIGAR